ncbi:hypothetical protein NQ166_01585 [Microbacterium sp. zg.Y1090]|uniref:hypothetical protein n=1 Tax=Microbacterium wangruii TaxID=3049073 RepID=UPI00214B2DBD|nr:MULTISPECIES: hypothetical protein [unclassified Microbacterium]MCR2817518.1 hypothetical protein [Microbacterium sp. zg.Y1090]MDL5485838.1 hypothetical protein [Microbacterium sp. zg-Y1211]WIM28999.1 hypothetical protein QNO26_03625 [Microbacterium sp. zg-Y1090]
MPENITPDNEKDTIPTPAPAPAAQEPTTAPPAPAAPHAAPAAAEPQTPFLQRTWVKAAGATVAGIALLGVGFGAGWAVSDAVEPARAGNSQNAEIWPDGGPDIWQEDGTEQDGPRAPWGDRSDRDFGDMPRHGHHGPQEDGAQPNDGTQDEGTTPEEGDADTDSRSDSDRPSDSDRQSDRERDRDSGSDRDSGGDRKSDRTAPDSDRDDTTDGSTSRS